MVIEVEAISEAITVGKRGQRSIVKGDPVRRFEVMKSARV